MKITFALLSIFVLIGLILANPQVDIFLKGKNNVQAGVAKVNATVPIGAPLAGYNHGLRRVPHWPIPQFKKYTTFMTPSQGILSPTWAKCLILKDTDSNTQLAVITVDAIGADATLLKIALEKAQALGVDIPLSNIVLSASHTHSGPGAVTSELLWSLAPATDLLVPEVRDGLAASFAKCLAEAKANLRSASIGVTIGNLTSVTRNRRAGYSPYVKPTSIDPQLSLISVNDAQSNTPIVTLWNFAIHGTCFGSDNMFYHGDIMGYTNELIEQLLPGVAMFVNSDAGDIAPTGEACHNGPFFEGGHTIASAVVDLRKTTQFTTEIDLQVESAFVQFGPTNMNLTLARVANCTSGGFLDVCTFCSAKFLNCDANLHLGEKWIDTNPRFTAARLVVNGQKNLIVTNPGEALSELGRQIRQDAKSLGFDNTLLFGYSNSHLGYFAPPDEYEVGGYESILTLWGEYTSELVRKGAYQVMNSVKSA